MNCHTYLELFVSYFSVFICLVFFFYLLFIYFFLSCKGISLVFGIIVYTAAQMLVRAQLLNGFAHCQCKWIVLSLPLAAPWRLHGDTMTVSMLLGTSVCL